MKEDIIVMNQKEIIRLELIQKIIQKQASQKDISKQLGLSDRQVRRIQRRVEKEGVKGVIHQHRGGENVRKIKEKEKKKIINLYQKQYEGFSSVFFSEKLEKEHGKKISRETIRKWLQEAGIKKSRRKRKEHLKWRERKKYEGEMIQMDGSHHDWLEGRGAKLVLMGYIDDASNRVYGKFYNYEGTIPAMDSLKGYIKKNGIPQSIYLDCHTTYKALKKDRFRAQFYEQEPAMSQFERSCSELGIKVIHAYSPQAKGRIERLFRTLQDRLVKELRLLDVRTIERANEVLVGYLKEHNKRFMLKPVSGANVHRKQIKGLNLDHFLCIKQKHKLRNDNTIQHEGQLYQVLEYSSQKQLEVWNHLDGRMSIVGRNRRLKYKTISKIKEKVKVKLSDRIRVKLPESRLKGKYGTFKVRAAKKANRTL